MNYCLAVFSSITYANRRKKILDSKIGYVALMHAPAGISDKGCSYCLRFRPENLRTVKETAEKNGVKIRGFYEETEKGYRSIPG